MLVSDELGYKPVVFLIMSKSNFNQTPSSCLLMTKEQERVACENAERCIQFYKYSYNNLENYSEYIIEGSSVLRYNHIQYDCEKQLLEELDMEKFHLQSDFKVFSVDSWNDFFDSAVVSNILRKHDNVTKLIEDIACLCYGVSMCRNKKDIIFNCINFLKLRCGNNSLIYKTTGCIEDIMTRVTDSMLKDAPLTSDDEVLEADILRDLDLQSDFLDTSRSILSMYQTVRFGPLFKRCQKLLTYLIAFALFKPFGYDLKSAGYSALEREAIERKCWNSDEGIFHILETLQFLCERGHACFKTGSIDALLLSGSSFDKFFIDCQKIKKWHLIIGHPDLMENEKITEHSFLAALDSALERGESISKYAKGDKMDKKQINQLLNDLHSIRTHHLTIAYALKDRRTPFTVLLFGDTGIGKSTFQNILFTHFGIRRNQPLGDEFKYVKNPVAKYWDNFRTNMWCLIQDDIGFLNPNAAPSGDPTCMETIQICNNVAFTPDQASLDMKGKMPMRCELVIGSTNTKALNAYNYFSCPSAFQRRYKYILTLKLKEEYTNDKGMLDTDNLPLNDEGTYPDYWYIDVEYIAPRSVHDRDCKVPGEVKNLHSKLEMKDFLKWYNIAIDKHYNEQDQFSQSTENLKKVQLCQLCKLPSGMCECELQSEIIEYHLFLNFMIWLIRMYVFCKVFILPICTKFYFTYSRYMFVSTPHRYTWFYMKVMSAKIAPLWCVNLYNNFNIKREYYYEKFIRKYPHEYWKKFGVETAYKMSGPTFLVNTACVLGLLFFSYKLFKTDKKVEEIGEKLEPKLQSDVNTGKIPKAAKEEPNNVWYNDSFDLHQMDLGQKSLGWNTMSESQIHSKLALNCVSLSIKIDQKTARRTSAFCVGGQIYLLNSHFFKDLQGDQELTIFFQATKQGVNPNITLLIDVSTVFFKPESDVCLIELRGLPPREDFTDLFCKKTFDAKFDGFYLRRTYDGDITAKPVQRIRLQRDQYDQHTKCSMDAWHGLTKSGCHVGDCGSILVVKTGMGPVILGIHYLGNPTINSVCAIRIDQEFLKEAVSKMTTLMVQGNTVSIDAPSVKVELVELHRKSPFRYLNEGSAMVCGSLTLPRAHGKSRVERTPMNDYLSKHGYETKYTDPDLVSWRPWHLAAREMVRPANLFKPSILRECVQAFSDDIINLIPSDILQSTLHVYDNFTAINGAAGVTFVDKINRNTSMGHPYNRSKRFYIKPIEAVGDNLDPVTFTDEILTQIHDIEVKYRAGLRNNPIFRGNLKDEAVTELKSELGKTRLFAGAPVAWSIVNRKYTLSIIRLIQSNQYTFECACGIICQSKEWEHMRNYLTKFGDDRLVAGDFEKFDKRMCAELIQCAFDVLINICGSSGNYDTTDLKVLRGIAIDTAFAWMNFNGDLVSFFGSNPSGHPLTVIINSLVNSLYMRYCFVSITKKDAKDFKKFVNLMTYGDDNIMNISTECDEFNHTSIQKCLADVGVGYTMADKHALSIPYIHIDACSFLKRTWRFDRQFGGYVAPLDHDSIEKMLMVWVRSKTISAPEQCIAVLSSAVMEYAFYGQEVFDDRVKILKKMCVDLELDIYLSPTTFPTFDELINRYQNAQRKPTGASAIIRDSN